MVGMWLHDFYIETGNLEKIFYGEGQSVTSPNKKYVLYSCKMPNINKGKQLLKHKSLILHELYSKNFLLLH